MARPSLRRIILLPFEMFAVAHIGLALFIAVATAGLAIVTPRVNSLMAYRAIVDGQRLERVIPVSIRQIPERVQNMFVYLEDRHFYTHFGLDLGAIREAYEQNQEAGRFVRGASTITQQLARTLFLTTHKNYYRKYVEAFIAVEMDFFLSKQRILELYLNSIEWGPGIFGIGAASEHYYHKPVANLSIDQLRRLATILPSPLRYTPFDFQKNPALLARYNYLLSK